MPDLSHDDPHLSRLRWLRAAEAVETKLAELARVHIAELEAAALRRRLGEGRQRYVARGMRSDWLLAALRVKLALMRLGDLCRRAGFNPDQPRVPAGSPDGGQWTSGGFANDGRARQDQLDQTLTTAPDQPSRSDLSQLQAIANDPVIRSRIDEAWNASNPHGTSPREHGFWISRNETTGELFTRPFANPGSARSITPGSTPSDAIAFFHTHPLRPEFGGIAGPSRSDIAYAAAVGLSGLLQSHNGMYYFGPLLRPLTSR